MPYQCLLQNEWVNYKSLVYHIFTAYILKHFTVEGCPLRGIKAATLKCQEQLTFGLNSFQFYKSKSICIKSMKTGAKRVKHCQSVTRTSVYKKISERNLAWQGLSKILKVGIDCEKVRQIYKENGG